MADIPEYQEYIVYCTSIFNKYKTVYTLSKDNITKTIPIYYIPVEDLDKFDLLSLSWNLYGFIKAYDKKHIYSPVCIRILSHMARKYENSLVLVLARSEPHLAQALMELNLVHRENSEVKILYDQYIVTLIYEIIIWKILPEINKRRHVPVNFLMYLKYCLN